MCVCLRQSAKGVEGVRTLSNSGDGQSREGKARVNHDRRRPVKISVHARGGESAAEWAYVQATCMRARSGRAAQWRHRQESTGAGRTQRASNHRPWPVTTDPCCPHAAILVRCARRKERGSARWWAEGRASSDAARAARRACLAIGSARAGARHVVADACRVALAGSCSLRPLIRRGCSSVTARSGCLSKVMLRPRRPPPAPPLLPRPGGVAIEFARCLALRTRSASACRGGGPRLMRSIQDMCASSRTSSVVCGAPIGLCGAPARLLASVRLLSSFHRAQRTGQAARVLLATSRAPDQRQRTCRTPHSAKSPASQAVGATNLPNGCTHTSKLGRGPFSQTGAVAQHSCCQQRPLPRRAEAVPLVACALDDRQIDFSTSAALGPNRPLAQFPPANVHAHHPFGATIGGLHLPLRVASSTYPLHLALRLTSCFCVKTDRGPREIRRREEERLGDDEIASVQG